MSRNVRRIAAAILLVMLIVVPFWNWQLGAVLWMCAWLVFIFQNLYSRHNWKFGENDQEDDRQE